MSYETHVKSIKKKLNNNIHQSVFCVYRKPLDHICRLFVTEEFKLQED